MVYTIRVVEFLSFSPLARYLGSSSHYSGTRLITYISNHLVENNLIQLYSISLSKLKLGMRTSNSVYDCGELCSLLTCKDTADIVNPLDALGSFPAIPPFHRRQVAGVAVLFVTIVVYKRSNAILVVVGPFHSRTMKQGNQTRNM